ncbi:hypothetical protein FO519_006921 [Halicephalobus sp. NKZ332]|nr:hypothetical protein FO519_006921 [Halicephalobus sp. NKZ332]
MESPASSSSQHATPVPTSSQFDHPKDRERHHSSSGKDERKHLKLVSPFGSDSIYFTWNPDPKHNCVNEIVDIIRTATSFIPEIKEVINKSEVLTKTDFKSYDSVKAMCKKFNKAASSYYKSIAKPGEKPKTEYATGEVLKLICCKAYNRSVDNEKKLNKHYPAFSSQTYGETSYERLRSIIEEIQPKESDVFVDLGSGVGNLVVQMAGGSKVKRSIGIEIADLPSAFAKKMEIEFKSLMRWFGKKYRPFQLHHGDFLDEKFRSIIQQDASVLFINNYAFTADLEERIKNELFQDLKEGTKIISSKPYAIPNRQITHRQLGDIGAIVDVIQLKDCKEPCSWTSNTVPYYLHVINRAKYGTCQEWRHTKQEWNGNEFKYTYEFGNCSWLFGPTTRRKWNQYVNEMEAKKKEGPEPSVKLDISIPMEIDVRPPTPSSTEALRARTASIVNTIESVADGSAGSVKALFSPLKKKPKKVSPDSRTPPNRGRPRKNGSQTKCKISQEAMEGMELMHNMTREACTSNPMEAVFDPSFILTDVQSSMRKTKVKTEITSGVHKYPNLDVFMNELKTLYVRFLDSFQTEEFVHTLQRRDRAIENHITDEGVAIFKDAMRQHGVDMEKPKSTLEKAKRLLQRYNHVVEIADALETEMALLESDSKDMIADYSVLKGGAAPKQEPDDHAQVGSAAPQAPLQVRLDPTTAIPPATPSAASVHSIRTVIPPPQMPAANVANVGLDQMLLTSLAENFSQQNFNNNLFQNLQAIANLNQPLTAQASSTNFNNYSNLSSDLLNIINSGKLDGLTERVNGSNFSLFNGSNTALPSVTSNSTIPASVSVTAQQPSTSVATTVDVNGTAPKKPRARTVRAPSNKKNSMTKESEDPARKEEIDKKIMDIVQIALEVDNSGGVSNTSPANGTVAGKKRTSTEAGLPQPNQTTVLVAPQNVNQTIAQNSASSNIGSTGFSSPNANSATQALYQRLITSATPFTSYAPTTTVTTASISDSQISQDLMNYFTVNGASKDISDASTILQSLVRSMNGSNQFAGLLNGQNGVSAQYGSGFTSQSVNTVTNGNAASPTVSVAGSVSNGNPF